MYRYCIALIFLSTLCGWVAAQEVHGFVSQGFLKSTEYDFRDGTKDGSFQFTELALNVTARPSQYTRIGLQLFARDLGELGDLEPKIDWAYGEYRKYDALGFRIGRNKMPLGLYNKERDAEFLRSTIFQPQAVYDEQFRNLTNAYNGVELFGVLKGVVDYEIYGGSIDLDESLPILQDLLALLDPTLSINAEIKARVIYGGFLKWSTPLDGLNLAVSYVTGDLSVEDRNSGYETFQLDKTEIQAVSAEYTRNNLTIQAEYEEFNIPVKTQGVQLLEVPPLGWYGLVAYRINDSWEVSYNYDVSYTWSNDKDGYLYQLTGLPNHLNWNKDHTLSLRYDFSGSLTFKAEYHDINGTKNISQPSMPDHRPDWSWFALKASYNF